MGKGKKNKVVKQPNKGQEASRRTNGLANHNPTDHRAMDSFAESVFGIGKRQQSRGNNQGKNNKKRQWNNRHHASDYFYNSNTADDVRLRESIEGDGTRTVVDMAADGNCLFRSLADQLYYDYGQAHVEVRQEIMDYIEHHEDFFGMFLDLDDEEGKGEDASDFAAYVQMMRQDGEWGGNLELVAASRLYRRHIRVFSTNLAALTMEDGSGKHPAGPDLWVSYHDNDHYNSVRDNSRAGKPPPPPIRTFVKQDSERESSTDNDTTTSPSIAPSKAPSTTSIYSQGSDTSTEPGIMSENALTGVSATTTITTTTHNNNTHNNNDDDDDDDHDPHRADPCKPKRTIHANALCPCGSGLKYKKCCKEQHRRDARRLRMPPPGNAKIDDHSLPDMEGNFRVLKI